MCREKPAKKMESELETSVAGNVCQFVYCREKPAEKMESEVRCWEITGMVNFPEKCFLRVGKVVFGRKCQCLIRENAEKLLSSVFAGEVANVLPKHGKAFKSETKRNIIRIVKDAVIRKKLTSFLVMLLYGSALMKELKVFARIETTEFRFTRSVAKRSFFFGESIKIHNAVQAQ